MKLLQGECVVNKLQQVLGLSNLARSVLLAVDRNIAQAQELLERERVNWTECDGGEGKGGRGE